MNSLRQPHEVLRGLAGFGVVEVGVARPDFSPWAGVRDGPVHDRGCVADPSVAAG
jgi:hypothetical protein